MVPLADWVVDAESFISQLRHKRSELAKAATDKATVYRPIPVCRLLDTRGFPAAASVAGPLAANSTTNVASAGKCGIPNNGLVAGLSISFTVQNLTVNNGGYIAFLPQGAAVSGTNSVFNPGAEWTATTANISLPNDSGNFAIYVALSQVHVVVDVNGYYQDLALVDVGSQELEITGNATGEVLQVTNSGGGAALGLSSAGAALSVQSGAIRAVGAGLGTNTFATIHRVLTGGAFGAGGTLCAVGADRISVLDNAQSNGDPNAILFIMARGVVTLIGTYDVRYCPVGCGCVAAAENKWTIRRSESIAFPNGYEFNVLIIKP